MQLREIEIGQIRVFLAIEMLESLRDALGKKLVFRHIPGSSKFFIIEPE
jgi:hypothetical protein